MTKKQFILRQDGKKNECATRIFKTKQCFVRTKYWGVFATIAARPRAVKDDVD